jgi:hypothetical protein
MPKRFVEAVAKRQELERALLARANAPPRAKPARPKPTCHIHEVRYPGETLSIIAKWYTGDVKNWRALTKVNPKLNPNHIIIGARIRIPRKLLNTRKPMPRNFIVLTRPQREPKASPSAISREATSEKTAEPVSSTLPPEAEAGEPELFGPR